MTKEAMNWNNKIGGKKAERIPCPDGIEGCLVGHYKVIEEQTKQEQDEPMAYINVEQRKLEWSKYTSWQTPTVVNLPKIPLYTHPQPKQNQGEPVATLIEHHAFTDGIVRFDGVENMEQLPVGTKLYTTPQTKEWVGLTEYEIKGVLGLSESWVGEDCSIPDMIGFAKAIEAKLRKKNHVVSGQ